MADKKLGAYICKGCGIGERLDIAQLEKVAKREGKVGFAKQHDFLCNSERPVPDGLKRMPLTLMTLRCLVLICVKA